MFFYKNNNNNTCLAEVNIKSYITSKNATKAFFCNKY